MNVWSINFTVVKNIWDVNVLDKLPAGRDGAEAGNEIGARLRRRRKLRGLSLQDVAARGGVSIGLLSQIERGLSSPSLNALRQVCAVLDMPVGWLFDVGGDEGAADRDLVVREAARRRIDLGSKGMVKELLTPDACPSLQLMRIVIRPGGASGDLPYLTEGRARAAVVLSGALGLEVDGRTLELTAGDSFAFEGAKPLRFWCAGDAPCEIVWAVTPALY